MKGKNDWEIKLSGAIFFVSAWFFILISLFLIASALFAEKGNFTKTDPWMVLELIVGNIKKILPNLIGGITPTSIPVNWSNFSYLHALCSLIFLCFGIFILRVRVGVYKRKKRLRIIAMVLSYFFAIYWLFLFILWFSGDNGPLMFILTAVFFMGYFYMGIFFASKDF